MPVHQIKITKKMTCGGCTGTVEAALRGVDGVTDVVVSLEDQTATITTDSDEKACQCTKAADGKCKCGSNCNCMLHALMAAVEEVGFGAACGTGGAGPCGSAGCTCGDNCQCGDNCTCAGCPGKCGTGAGPCNSPACTCGPNCQCGDSCTCAGCPKPSSSALTITIEASHLAYVAIGVAIFAAGWMAAKRFGKDK